MRVTYKNKRGENSQVARGAFLVDHAARSFARRGRGSGILHFHLELPLAHNHPLLRPSAKISEAPEYPFTRGGGGDLASITRPPEYITSSPGISRYDLSRSGGKRSRESPLWAESGGEGDTGSVKIRRSRKDRESREREREREHDKLDRDERGRSKGWEGAMRGPGR